MEELSHLLLALYQASREVPPEQFQDWTLNLVKRVLPFDSSWWASGILTAGGVDVHALHLHNLPDRTEFLVRYSEVAHQDKCALAILSQGGGVRSFDPAVFAGKETSGFRAYQKWLGIENGVVASDFDRKTRMVRWFSLFRGDPDLRFTEIEIQATRLLMPHMLEALEINRLTHLEHMARDSAGRRYFLAIADRRGFLYHAEAGFLELMREEEGIPANGRIGDDVLRLLADGRRYVGRSVVMLASRKVDLLFLRARRLTGMDALSMREREIARLVAQGRTYKDIAKALRIMPATARNHIAAIHAKAAVRSNAELAAKLLELD